MGSATRQALSASTAALSSLGTADVATGEQLLAAGRVIGDSAQLLAALAVMRLASRVACSLSSAMIALPSVRACSRMRAASARASASCFLYSSSAALASA